MSSACANCRQPLPTPVAHCPHCGAAQELAPPPGAPAPHVPQAPQAANPYAPQAPQAANPYAPQAPQAHNPYAPPTTNAPAPGIAPGMVHTSRPGTVTAAAIMWIVVGGLGILGQLLSLGAGFRPSSIFGLFISIAFLAVGIQTLSGKAKDTLGNAIGALVLGVLSLGLMVALSTAIGPAAFFLLIQVILFITSGILALVGRSGYKAWRASKYI